MKKTVFIPILASACLLFAFGAYLVINALLSGGAKTAEDAIWEYERACMIYDADTMVEMSSDYNVKILSGSLGYDRSELKKHLNELYKAETPLYEKGALYYNVGQRTYYEPGSDEFDALTAEYNTVADSSKISRFACISLNICKEQRIVLKYTGYIALISDRWFFFKTK